jgi:tetratricopeptide (TPR) repeat protein
MLKFAAEKHKQQQFLFLYTNLSDTMTTLLKRAFFFAMVFLGVQSIQAQTHEDAFMAMQLEQWDKAIDIYSGLVKANPADQTALLTMGNAYLAKGDKDKAKMSFEQAFNAKSDGPLAFVANGRIMLLQGNTAEADKQFAKAAKNGKKDVNALRQIGESYLYAPPGVKPNFTRSEELLKAALDASSKDVTTIMTLGYCYKEMPHGGLAAQQYELAESMQPKNVFIKYMLAKVYRAAKLYSPFMSYLDKALALDPKFTLALREKAYYLYYERKWEAALVALETLSKNGTNITTDDEMLLANTYFINKKYDECSKLVDHIIAEDRSKTYLIRLLAYCEYEKGNYQKSLDMMQRYFKEAPADKIIPGDYMYLGRTLVKTKGDTMLAIGNLKKSIELDTVEGSEAWKLNQEIGDLYYAKKGYCNSAQYYTMYIDSLVKPQPTDFYKLGVAQFSCKDDTMRFIKAEKSFIRVTEMAPKAGLGWNWAAKSAARQDPDIEARPELLPDFGKAMKYYEKYVEIAGVDPAKNKKDLTDAYLYMGYYYWKKGDNAKAKEVLQKILVFDPVNTTVPEMINAIDGVATPDSGTPAVPAVPNGKQK